MEQQYVIVEGNPMDGFNIHGPFADHDEADEYASAQLDGDWWITTLQHRED